MRIFDDVDKTPIYNSGIPRSTLA